MAIEGIGAVGIGSERIAAMARQLRDMAARAQGPQEGSAMPGPLNKVNNALAAAGVKGPSEIGAAGRVDFGAALKAALDQVNGMQSQAETLGKRFAMGDDTVHLSDVMIAGQKASIAFQATVQVRNKLTSAYHDVMNMPV